MGLPSVHDGSGWKALSKGKTSALLYYLAYKDDWVGRDELILLFWPDNTDKQARSNLRTLLTRADKRLKAFGVEIEPTRLRWQVETDLKNFQQAVGKKDWQAAYASYTGLLLSSFPCDELPEYESWLLAERESLQQAYVDASLNYVQALEDESNYNESTQILETLHQRDKTDEHILRTYLTSLSLNQKWKLALDTYGTFSRFLAQEFGGEPDELTHQLVEQIRLASRANMSKTLDVIAKLEPASSTSDTSNRYSALLYYLLEPFQLKLSEKNKIIDKALFQDQEAFFTSFRAIRTAGLIDKNGFTKNRASIVKKLEEEPELKPFMLLKLIEASHDDKTTLKLSQLYFDEAGTFPEHLLPKLTPSYLTETKLAFEKGNYSQVINLLKPLHEAETYFELEHNQDVAFNLAYALEREGRFADALDVLTFVEVNLKIKILTHTLKFRIEDFDNRHNELEEIENELSYKPSWEKAQLYNIKGHLSMRGDDYANAITFFQEAESIWDSIGDQNRRLGELTNIALNVDAYLGLEESEKAFQFAWEISEQNEVSVLEKVRILYNWSSMYHDRSFTNNDRKLYELGKEKYTEALNLSRNAGQLSFMARIHLQEGLYHEAQGNTSEASTAYKKTREFARQSGEWLILGMATFRLGATYNDLVRMKQGLELMQSTGGTDTYNVNLYLDEYQQFVNANHTDSLSA